jgi:hypothetical protein
MAEIGRRIGGRKLGIILAILTAVSPAQIYRSLLLTQHSFVCLSAALALLAFISFIKTKKSKYIFILGLAIGSGISMHYQALNLLFFALVFFNKKFFKNFALFFSGLALPLAPLLYWDFLQGWTNAKNILDYFFIGQARLWLPDRWLNYLFQFWPLLWSSIIGQLWVFGWILPILFLISLIGTRKKTVWWIMIVFLIQFILLRYHKSERFEGYLLYFHPLVILFSGLGIEYLGQKMHLAGFLLLLLVFLFSLQADWRQISTTQNQSHLLAAQVSDIKKALPGKKFSLFDYELSSQAYSYALSAYLDKENLIDEQGIPLGACLSDCPGDYPKLSTVYPPVIIVNLGDYHSSDWYNVNPKTVFESVTLWWKKEKLQSSFSLTKYLRQIFFKLFLR